jgi:hypothetical protein
MQINPPIVLTFTRQRWSRYHLQSYTSLVCVQIMYILTHTTSLLILYSPQYKHYVHYLHMIYGNNRG